MKGYSRMKIAVISLAAVAALGLFVQSGFAGDPTAGKIVFGKCALCHTIDPVKKFIGPTLFGVVGRHSASVEGYAYSPAMKGADKTWDEATLDVYLTKPQTLVPGTKMTFAGLSNADDRANLIAYLATLK
jgi:cytochrome c